MPRRTVTFVSGDYYHLYNRGNNRGTVFFEAENYVFFLRRLRDYLLPVADVIAYCLMPTHYHLMVRVKEAGMSHQMQLLSIAYTKAVNKRYGRVGALFQGVFQAKPIGSDEYLVHLSRYVHMNPVMAGLVARPEDWEYSSYVDYVGARHGTLPQPGVVLAQFVSPAAYAEFARAYAPRDEERIREVLLD